MMVEHQSSFASKSFEQKPCFKMFEKSLALHPQCLNKSLKNFAHKHLNKSLASPLWWLNISLPLHPKVLNKSLASKCLKKSLCICTFTHNGWTKVLVPTQHVWTNILLCTKSLSKCLASHPKWLNKSLVLHPKCLNLSGAKDIFPPPKLEQNLALHA